MDRTVRVNFGLLPCLKALMAAALLSVCWIADAAAVTRDGVTLPDTYQVDGQTLKLNGIGVRKVTFLGVRVYVAALYLPHESHDAQQIMKSNEPKVVLLHFVHSGSKAQVEAHYREGAENNCAKGGCAASDQADFEHLVAAAPAVEPGDQSIFVFAGSRVRVYANTRVIADFVNADLSHQLLAGFIGQHPPTQALHSALLGLPEN